MVNPSEANATYMQCVHAETRTCIIRCSSATRKTDRQTQVDEAGEDQDSNSRWCVHARERVVSSTETDKERKKGHTILPHPDNRLSCRRNVFDHSTTATS